jgi:hypothetical protein
MSEQAAAERLAAMPAQHETETGVDVTQPITSAVPEKFIQVDRDDIVERVLEKLFEPQQKHLAGEVVRYMCALRQWDSAKLLDSVIEFYDPFNPDDETVNVDQLSPSERRARLENLRLQIVDLVASANYIEMDEATLKKVLDEQSPAGFSAEVDLTEYDFHLLFYRGAIKDQIFVTSWKTLWFFERPLETDAYRRLFLALKLKPFEARVAELMAEGMSRKKAEKRVRQARNQQMLEGVSENTLHLKIFRRMPKCDLEILFPNAQIHFNLFDRLWLWIGSGGSTLFAIVTAGLKFVAAFAISIFFVFFTVAGAVGAIIRTITSFFNTRTRYMAKLAKNLYFHNIASNQSVLAMLSDDAEEEDIKEAVLTYALLLRYGHRGLEEVKLEAEKFLQDEFGVPCDFDIEDGCVHLRKLGLLVVDETGAPRIRDLDDALGHLVEEWRQAPSAA